MWKYGSRAFRSATSSPRWSWLCCKSAAIHPSSTTPSRTRFAACGTNTNSKPIFPCRARIDRKRVGEGKSVSVRVDIGGGRMIKKKISCTYYRNNQYQSSTKTNKLHQDMKH